MSAALQVELREGVLSLMLNRPEKRNALNAAAVDALTEQLERAELDREVRVVALRGAGPDFCAGADLAELLASARAADGRQRSGRAPPGRRVPADSAAAASGGCSGAGAGARRRRRAGHRL